MPQSSRSREGAWIEIPPMNALGKYEGVAPVRERGLKSIVTPNYQTTAVVAPVRERGLKFDVVFQGVHLADVAPVRERGLKSPALSLKALLCMSLP